MALKIDQTRALERMKYNPPWEAPYIIGIAGYSGLGKTSVSQQIISQINQPWTVLLLFDNFYNPLLEEELAQAFASNWDFDLPLLLDLDLLVDTVQSLKQGQRVKIPVYLFCTHNRTDRQISLYGANVIIIEGIYALYDPRLLEMMDLRVFVDTDLDICLARRLTRDILYRGRDLAGGLKQWEKFVKPNAVKFVAPTMANADLVIPRGLDNTTAIDVMIQHIRRQLLVKLEAHVTHLQLLGEHTALPSRNLHVIAPTHQVVGINLFLLAEDTARDDFIFYFDRIARLLIEEACATYMEDVFSSTTLVTPYGHSLMGQKPTRGLLVVSVIPLGDCFTDAIKNTFRDIPIGKVLIQLDALSGEPQLHFQLIPKIDFTACKVLLMDAQIILGAAAIMAIQILVDHGISPADIVVVSYLCTEVGLRRIFHVFPDVNVVVGLVSSLGNEGWAFRERFVDKVYFGT